METAIDNLIHAPWHVHLAMAVCGLWFAYLWIWRPLRRWPRIRREVINKVLHEMEVLSKKQLEASAKAMAELALRYCPLLQGWRVVCKAADESDQIKGPAMDGASGPRLASDFLPVPPEFIARLRAVKQPDGSYRPEFNGHWLGDCRIDIAKISFPETIKLRLGETAKDAAAGYNASQAGEPVEARLDPHLQTPPDGYKWRTETVQVVQGGEWVDFAGIRRNTVTIHKTYQLAKK